MREVRDIIGRIADIAGSVAQSSDQQIGAIQEVGQSANSAAQGATRLGEPANLRKRPQISESAGCFVAA
jgi:hypothetical protein